LTTWYHDFVQYKAQQIAETYVLARNCWRKQAELRAKKYDLKVKDKEWMLCVVLLPTEESRTERKVAKFLCEPILN